MHFTPPVLFELCVCFLCALVYIQNQTCQKAILREVSSRKAPAPPPPRPPSPSTPASWPVCGPASRLLVFRALGPGAGPSWSALQERGLLGDPQSGLGSGWCRVWGWGGGSRPTDWNSEYSPAWAANRFQIGGVRARAAAAWLHKQPVAPDGGWLQPGEQVHGGLGGGSRWRTPSLPGWGREAPASRPWLPLIPLP